MAARRSGAFRSVGAQTGAEIPMLAEGGRVSGRDHLSKLLFGKTFKDRPTQDIPQRTSGRSISTPRFSAPSFSAAPQIPNFMMDQQRNRGNLQNDLLREQLAGLRTQNQLARILGGQGAHRLSGPQLNVDRARFAAMNPRLGLGLRFRGPSGAHFQEGGEIPEMARGGRIGAGGRLRHIASAIANRDHLSGEGQKALAQSLAAFQQANPQADISGAFAPGVDIATTIERRLLEGQPQPQIQMGGQLTEDVQSGPFRAGGSTAPSTFIPGMTPPAAFNPAQFQSAQAQNLGSLLPASGNPLQSIGQELTNTANIPTVQAGGEVPGPAVPPDQVPADIQGGQPGPDVMLQGGELIVPVGLRNEIQMDQTGSPLIQKLQGLIGKEPEPGMQEGGISTLAQIPGEFVDFLAGRDQSIDATGAETPGTAMDVFNRLGQRQSPDIPIGAAHHATITEAATDALKTLPLIGQLPGVPLALGQLGGLGVELAEFKEGANRNPASRQDTVEDFIANLGGGLASEAPSALKQPIREATGTATREGGAAGSGLIEALLSILGRNPDSRAGEQITTTQAGAPPRGQQGMEVPGLAHGGIPTPEQEAGPAFAQEPLVDLNAILSALGFGVGVGDEGQLIGSGPLGAEAASQVPSAASITQQGEDIAAGQTFQPGDMGAFTSFVASQMEEPPEAVPELRGSEGRIAIPPQVTGDISGPEGRVSIGDQPPPIQSNEGAPVVSLPAESDFHKAQGTVSTIGAPADTLGAEAFSQQRHASALAELARNSPRGAAIHQMAKEAADKADQTLMAVAAREEQERQTEAALQQALVQGQISAQNAALPAQISAQAGLQREALRQQGANEREQAKIASRANTKRIEIAAKIASQFGQLNPELFQQLMEALAGISDDQLSAMVEAAPDQQQQDMDDLRSEVGLQTSDGGL